MYSGPLLYIWTTAEGEIKCILSSFLSPQFDIQFMTFISTVTSACTASSSVLQTGACQGKHNFPHVAVYHLQTTLFTARRWLSCKSLFTRLFPLSLFYVFVSGIWLPAKLRWRWTLLHCQEPPQEYQVQVSGKCVTGNPYVVGTEIFLHC